MISVRAAAAKPVSEEEVASRDSWNSIVRSLEDLHPDSFQDLPEAPASSKDPAAGEWGLRKEVYYSHLPWHPTMASFLEATAKDVLTSASSSSKEKGPLLVGDYPRPHRSFPSKFLAPRGAASSVSVAAVNSTLGDLSTAKIRDASAIPKSQRQLELDERLAKELCAVQSAVMWLHQLQDHLVGVLHLSDQAPEAISLMKEISSHLRALDKLQSDFLSSLCGLAVLTRRDSWIRAVAGAIPKDLIAQLRSTSLLSPLLFDLPAEEVSAQRETRERRALLSCLKVSASAHPLMPPPDKPPKKPSGHKSSRKSSEHNPKATERAPEQSFQGGRRPHPSSGKDRRPFHDQPAGRGRGTKKPHFPRRK